MLKQKFSVEMTRAELNAILRASPRDEDDSGPLSWVQNRLTRLRVEADTDNEKEDEDDDE